MRYLEYLGEELEDDPSYLCDIYVLFVCWNYS